MTKIVHLIFFSIVLSSAQSTPSTEKTTIRDFKKFQDNFNNGDFGNIYEAYSDRMKEAITKEKAMLFFTKIKRGNGEIIALANFKTYKAGAICDIVFDTSRKRLYLSVKDNKINGLSINSVRSTISPKVSRQRLALPFDTIWYTHWGGNTLKDNYHIRTKQQLGAFDFAIRDSLSNTFRIDRNKNSNFYAWGKNILSPCDGIVVEAVDGIVDNQPGVKNNLNPHGNYIILKCNSTPDEFLAFYHFKINSINFKEGLSVKTGQVIGQCGNSGRSTEPHLHFHIQDNVDDTIAIGLITKFKNTGLLRNGKKTFVQDFSPIKGDFIFPIN